MRHQTESVAQSEVASGARFHGELADTWNSNYKKGGFKKRLAFVRRLLVREVVPGKKWLDAGCGGGMLTLEMSALGATGLAVDGSQEMIDAALRDVGVISGGFVFLSVESVSAIDVPEGCFDGVLCSSVVEYVGSVDCALREFNRVLKADGTLILSVPNKQSFIRRTQKSCRMVGILFGLDLFPYLSVSVHDFTKEDLLSLLGRYGFRARCIEEFDPFLHRSLTRFLPPALYFVVADKL